MDDKLARFLERPTGRGYLSARRELLADEAYCANPADLLALGAAIHECRLDDAVGLLDDLYPSWVLSAALHDLAAQLAERCGDEEEAEMERLALKACLQGILETGDGSRRRPYRITYTSDIYDTLAVFQAEPVRQRVVVVRQGKRDEVICQDGRTFYFLTEERPADSQVVAARFPQDSLAETAVRSRG